MESERSRSPLRDEFRTILQGVEQGDPVAIAEYVYYWQPYLLRVIRRRHRKGLALSDSDSMDVFQSAFRELLAGLQDKRFHPRHPESCIGIMLGLAQKKISRAASRQRTRCRHYYLRQLNPDLYQQECQRMQQRFDEAVRTRRIE
jgi:hypothetical protein